MPNKRASEELRALVADVGYGATKDEVVCTLIDMAGERPVDAVRVRMIERRMKRARRDLELAHQEAHRRPTEKAPPEAAKPAAPAAPPKPSQPAEAKAATPTPVQSAGDGGVETRPGGDLDRGRDGGDAGDA